MALFPSAPGGGEEVGHGWKGKGITTHVLIEGHGMPIGVSVTTAGGSEKAEVPKLLERVMKWLQPLKDKEVMPILEADKGYDSMPLRVAIIKMGVFPWIGWRRYKNRKKVGSTEGSYKRIRWKVERTHAWIKRSFRRLIARWERNAVMWLGFLNVALIMMWTDYLVG